MFEKYGGFRSDLGRCGDNLIGNEDTEFGSRLLGADEFLRYEPAAVVYHPVTKERLNRKYFFDWWFAYDRAVFRQTLASFSLGNALSVLMHHFTRDSLADLFSPECERALLLEMPRLGGRRRVGRNGSAVDTKVRALDSPGLCSKRNSGLEAFLNQSAL